MKSDNIIKKMTIKEFITISKWTFVLLFQISKPATIFWKIKFPLIMPGIIAAALLAFTLSIDDFIITFFTSGRGFDTLPIYVEGAIRRGTITTINSLSTIMIGLTLLLVVTTKRIRKIVISSL